MATYPAASSSSAPTASANSAAAAAEATDGPVLSVVSKRLRALRKKYNRIIQMEESRAAGKTLNREQEELLRSKPVVTALIDELERLHAPLTSALAEELSSRPAPPPAAAAAAASSSDYDSSIQDLLALVYFGSLFDVKPHNEFVSTMIARTHERDCCLASGAGLLVEDDLDAVSALAFLAALSPATAPGISHRDALQACAHHARRWLSCSDEPIHPDSTITYAGVRANLDKIMSLDYYTARTDIGTDALAAAAERYGAGGVQAQESIVVSPQAPVEENLAVEEHKDDEGPVNPTDEVPSAEAEERFDADVEDQE